MDQLSIQDHQYSAPSCGGWPQATPSSSEYWECEYDFPNLLLDSNEVIDSDFCGSDLQGIYNSSNRASPSYSESESSLCGVQEHSNSFLGSDALPDEIAEFIEDYVYPKSNACSSATADAPMIFPVKHSDIEERESNWRRIPTNLFKSSAKPSDNRSQKNHYGAVYNRANLNSRTSQQNTDIFATSLVKFDIGKCVKNTLVCDSSINLQYQKLHSENSNQLLNSAKDRNRIESKRYSNRMSAHRYRSKMKALAEDVKMELADAVRQYRHAMSAYQKTVSAFNELESLVLKIMEDE